jgi:hypothetical protein
MALRQWIISMNTNRILKASTIILVIAGLSFIVYCNADLLQSYAHSQRNIGSANVSTAVPSATPPSKNNDVTTPAIYAELEKRLQAIRKE